MENAAKAAYQVAGLLEKMNSKDKDFRFMAVSDLMNEFNKNSIKLDEDSERKVVRMLIRLLEDNNGEVQNLSVRCLGTLAPKVREPSCDAVIDALCENLVAKSDECREVSSTALGTFVKALPSGSLSTKIAIRLLPKLHAVLSKLSSESAAKNEILDIIGEVLMRNGSTLVAHHDETEKVLLAHVGTGRAAVKKRAIGALSHLAVAASPNLFNHIINALLQFVAEKGADLKMIVTALNAIARASSVRFAIFLRKVMPLLLDYSGREDDELREAAIQCMETLVVRCPKEAAPFYSAVEKALANALVYDPNYSYDDDSEEDMEMDDTEDPDDEEDVEDDFDDDDLSWKIRRASARAIQSMFDTRREDQLHLSQFFGPLLISRLKEREENVKADVFSAYSTFLKKLKQCNSSVELEVQSQLPSLLKAVTRILRGRNGRGRQHCFVLLSDLVRAQPGCLADSIRPIMDGVVSCLSDKTASAQMKIDVFVFLENALSTHPPELFRPFTSVIVPLISRAIADSFYKVSSQALVVCSLLLVVMRDGGGLPSEVDTLCGAAFERLKGDVDQEVKEKAILAVGSFLKNFPLGAKATEMAKVLVERVNNEATRLAAVKALNMVAESDNGSCIGPLLPSLLPLLSQMLRKNSRALKISSLSLLLVLTERFSSSLDQSATSSYLHALPSLFSDLDLQISQIALRILTLTARSLPSHLTDVLPTTLSAISNLTKSSLLQGATLQALLDFISAIVQNEVPGRPPFEDLLNQLSAPIYDLKNLPRQCFHSISAAVAVAAVSDKDSANAGRLTQQLSSQLKIASATDGMILFSLLTLGELGRRAPSVFASAKIEPEHFIMAAFDSPSEDIKSAAAHALGGLAVGSLSHYLPFILKQIDDQPKKQYLLLHALKEVIVCETAVTPVKEEFVKKVDSVWEMLMKHADCAEEGTRCVASECLGKLCHVNPAVLVPRLKEYVNSDSLHMRAAVVTSVKFMMTDEKKPIDDVLQGMMGDFLETAKDENLDVRRVALVVLNSAAHNKPELVRGLLPSLLPIVYGETNVRQELIREVEMGPFKHSVDDGLDLRKSAFECMYTLLDSCLDRINIFEYIAALENGLKDQHDIKLLSFLTLCKLAFLCPSDLTQRLDRVCEPLKQQLLAKTKPNAVKQEMDKMDELKRAVVRTLLALQALPDAGRHQGIGELRTMIIHNVDLKQVMETLEKDAHRGYSGNDAIMETA